MPKENGFHHEIAPARTAYDSYARYYDAMFDRRVKDLPLYEKLVSTKSPPYLEVGCGTGRVLSHLLQPQNRGAVNGPLIVGVDISDSMLAICREKNAQSLKDGSLQLKNHDFTVSKLTGESQFNAAFITFFTLNYVPEHLQLDFLSNIHDALSPDAIISIECCYPYLILNPDKAGVTYEDAYTTKDGKNIKFRTTAEMATPTIEQRELMFIEPDGEAEAFTLITTYISPEKGKNLLQVGGFTDIRHVHDYQLPGTDDFMEDPQGNNFVLMAKKL